MKTESVKLELMEWLLRLEDKRILTSLLQFKKAAEQADWADNLTPEQLESLQRGLLEIENKNVLDSKEFWSSYGIERL